MVRGVMFIAWRSLPAVGLAASLGFATSVLSQEAPREQIGPFADIDWSVGLRGGYSSSSATGGHPEIDIVPEASWSRTGESTTSRLGAGGSFAVLSNGAIQIDDAHASAEGSLGPGEFSTLAGSATITYGQKRLDDNSLPLGTTEAPRELTGTLSGSAAYDFGHVRVTGRLGATRYLEGPTQVGGTTVDNAENSYWQGNAGLRLGYDLGPLLDVFVDGEARYTAYDAPSASLLTYANGRTMILRAGVGYSRNSVLNAEISAGRSWYDYDDPSRTDQPSWVANASVTFQPDETLALTGALDSTLAPSTLSAGDTDAGMTASTLLRYVVNPWVTLRGSASADRTVAIGSGLSTWGYGAGGGFDLAASRNTSWTGDYAYRHAVGTTGTATDTHTITVGVTLHR